jgi:hypothetical protein
MSCDGREEGLESVVEKPCRPWRDSLLIPPGPPDLCPGLMNTAPEGAGLAMIPFRVVAQCRFSRRHILAPPAIHLKT